MPVLIGDVAKVSDCFAVQTNIVHVNGKRATYLTILKHSPMHPPWRWSMPRARCCRRFQAAAPDGLDLKLDFDQSVFVRAAIRT